MTTRLLSSARVQGRLHREEDAHLHEAAQGHAGAQKHESVLTAEVLHNLDVKSGEVVLDATAGQGGHSFAILSHCPEARVIALDADPAAVEMATKRLAKFKTSASVVESNFEHLEKALRKEGIKEVNKALFDLGWNSGQLDGGKGFSFQVDEELNMSYGKKPASGFTAQEVLNEWEEKTLADVLYGYGEERYARRIAKAIVERRKLVPIKTTIELSELVRDAVPPAYRHGRIHPATKTFQALRIAVNDELGVIERGLEAAWKHLAHGGRIAVISFHSTEDRVVKQQFLKLVKHGGKLITKKPIAPGRSEISSNPRARSAKLRVIEKI
jgi:16S rRNA (cytosine1402-N4)-methyltransferase